MFIAKHHDPPVYHSRMDPPSAAATESLRTKTAAHSPSIATSTNTTTAELPNTSKTAYNAVHTPNKTASTSPEERVDGGDTTSPTHLPRTTDEKGTTADSSTKKHTHKTGTSKPKDKNIYRTTNYVTAEDSAQQAATVITTRAPLNMNPTKEAKTYISEEAASPDKPSPDFNSDPDVETTDSSEDSMFY